MTDLHNTQPTSPWYVPSRSNNGANCVQARKHGTAGMAIRDSKLDESPVHMFAAPAWDAFTASLNG